MPPPLVPPPANDIGAMTVPRYLQRWLDVNAITRLTRTSTFIQLLPFNQASSSWNGYSDIVFAYNFESPNAISLRGITIPVSSNYALCISYQTKGVVTRYLLWDASGSRLPETFPVYTGQPIKKNFRLEIWNTSQGAVSESSTLNFYTSKLGPFDYRYGQDSVLQSPDPIVSNFSVNGGGNVPLPLNVVVDFQSSQNVNWNEFNQKSGSVESWTDVLQGQILTFSGTDFSTLYRNNVGLNNGSVVQETNQATGYMNGNFISNQVAMVVIFTDPVILSGKFFTTGITGITLSISVLNGNSYFTAFGVNGIVPVIPNLIYFLVVDSANGILWAFNANNAGLIDKLKGTPISPTVGTTTVIGSGIPPNPTNPNELVSGGSVVQTGGQDILAQ